MKFPWSTLFVILMMLILSTISAQDNMTIEDDYENPKSDWRVKAN